MNKKRRKNRKRDLHLHLGPVGIKDHTAAAASCAVDTAADRDWFAAHPDENERERPCSSREIVAFGLPPGSTTVVFRGPFGRQTRAFVGPHPRRN